MALDLQRRAQRRMRLMVVTLSGIVVLLAAGLVGALIAGAGSSDESAGPSPSPEPSASGGWEARDPGFEPSETATPSGDYVAPEEWVRLPSGSDDADGLEVGFPHSTEGAVAMVAAATRNSWSWDVDQVRRGAEVYVSEVERAEVVQLAEESVQGVRQYVGLPADGPVPQDAALQAWPIGVQWEELDDDTVRVYILVRLAHTPGNGEPTETHLVPTVNDAVWEAGDWKLRSVPPAVAQAAPPPGDVGSEEFNTAGWVAIQEGDRR